MVCGVEKNILNNCPMVQLLLDIACLIIIIGFFKNLLDWWITNTYFGIKEQTEVKCHEILMLCYFDPRKIINKYMYIIESGTQKYGYELKTTLSTVCFVYNIEYNFQFT